MLIQDLSGDNYIKTIYETLSGLPSNTRSLKRTLIETSDGNTIAKGGINAAGVEISNGGKWVLEKLYLVQTAIRINSFIILSITD